jgi:flagellar biogenesis protein FliO
MENIGIIYYYATTTIATGTETTTAFYDVSFFLFLTGLIFVIIFILTFLLFWRYANS